MSNASSAVEPAAHSKKFIIFIDKVKFETEQAIWTGAQLLQLASKNPAEFQLFLKEPGGKLDEIKADQEVDLRDPGVEKFVTLPLDQTEGESVPSRREFVLPERDVEFLDQLGLRWEAVREGNLGRVIVYGYGLPPGYNVASADLNLRIETTYPDTLIDMVYFAPALVRQDRRPIGAVSECQFDGRAWQQWSRHRTQANPWRPGIDDISTQLALVDHWLKREFVKAAA